MALLLATASPAAAKGPTPRAELQRLAR
ncbi:MAG: hypothetical protein JWR63_3899, partial [Conexibacter sp.]|nr:hypothetical protein [Conexibacter sp.]